MATNLSPEMFAQLLKERQRNTGGYYKPETGEWVGTSGVESTNPMGLGDYNASGGISPDLMAAMGFADPTGQHYTYGNGGERGTGQIGDKYQILDSQGAYTGKDGTYSEKGMDPALMALMAAAAMYGGAAFMGGGVNPVMAGGSSLGGGAAGAGTAAAGTAASGFGTMAPLELLPTTMGQYALPAEMALAGGGAAGAAAGGAAAAGGGGAAAGGSALGTMAPLELLPSTMGDYALPGLMETVGGGASGLLSGAGSALKGAGSWLAPIVGAALGSQPTTTENNTTKKMDPRMDALVYGDGGFLNNATDWYKANKSGMNDEMRNALAQNRSLLNDPATMQGYKNMATQGQGLLNRPVASNPFTSAPDQRPQFGSNLLQRYLNGGLLGQ
jgi:hypothetical protein